jgi:DNA-damage-inducible protein J
MAQQKDMIRSRIDPAVKAEAQVILEKMGLSMSDAMRLFLHQVILEKGLPFDVKIPKKETLHALEDSFENKVFETSIEDLKKDWVNAQKH